MKKLNYSINNLNGLIKDLQTYRNTLQDKGDLFVKRLAEVGLPIIDQRAGQALGDGETGYNRSYIRIENEGGLSVAKLIYEGNDVLFIEFGAGVHYNGHPNSSPNPTTFKKGQGWTYSHQGGVELGYTIGSYSEKQMGLQDSWFYRDNTGSLNRSFGTKAMMPMYYASVEIITNIRRIAKEVFG